MSNPTRDPSRRILAVSGPPVRATALPVGRRRQDDNEIAGGAWSDHIGRTLSEDTWRTHVRRMAKEAGFGRQYHTRFSIGSEPGWPDDWFMSVTQRRMLFIEAKRQNGKLSVDQVWFLDDLARLRDTGFPIEVYVIRPLDRDSLVKTLFPIAELDGEPLHQWCLDQTCGRCTTDRAEAVERKGGRRGRRRRD